MSCFLLDSGVFEASWSWFGMLESLTDGAAASRSADYDWLDCSMIIDNSCARIVFSCINNRSERGSICC